MNVASTFARIDPQTVEKILAVPWLGSEFSSRIWADKDKLLRELTQTLSRGLVRGDSLDRMTKEFAKRMSVSESRAAVLIHTESAHIAAEASMKGYRETGVKEYRFLATLQLKTCSICGMLDGRVFKFSERETGVNFPPMHPQCHCTYTGVTEFNIGDKRAARDPVTGKSGTVPKNMTWEEWHKKYVEDDPAGALADKKYKNRHGDSKQYDRYVDRLGSKNVPKTLDAFQTLKYTEPEKWKTLQRAYRDQPIRDHIQSDAQPKTIEVGKQGKHIREHNNYIQGRSYLTISVDEAQTLVNRHAGTGELLRDTKNKWKHQELIRTKQQIGVDVDQLTGEERPTTDFKIHYSNKGVHIVPYKER
ncbi:polymorphic toxin type 50 domain-containing protein [Agathobaculum sp.]|uniref:polymorphic toxin type 50 domain-containing protein n=1 Tax=Agathobaculum sp. TaxID=2048138 RepID=UPI003AF604F5